MDIAPHPHAVPNLAFAAHSPQRHVRFPTAGCDLPVVGGCCYLYGSALQRPGLLIFRAHGLGAALVRYVPVYLPSPHSIPHPPTRRCCHSFSLVLRTPGSCTVCTHYIAFAVRFTLWHTARFFCWVIWLRFASHSVDRFVVPFVTRSYVGSGVRFGADAPHGCLVGYYYPIGRQTHFAGSLPGCHAGSSPWLVAFYRLVGLFVIRRSGCAVVVVLLPCNLRFNTMDKHRFIAYRTLWFVPSPPPGRDTRTRAHARCAPALRVGCLQFVARDPGCAALCYPFLLRFCHYCICSGHTTHVLLRFAFTLRDAAHSVRCFGSTTLFARTDYGWFNASPCYPSYRLAVFPYPHPTPHTPVYLHPNYRVFFTGWHTVCRKTAAFTVPNRASCVCLTYAFRFVWFAFAFPHPGSAAVPDILLDATLFTREPPVGSPHYYTFVAVPFAYPPPQHADGRYLRRYLAFALPRRTDAYHPFASSPTRTHLNAVLPVPHSGVPVVDSSC